MERKSILRKFKVNTGGSCYLNYDFFINNITSVRNTIKEKYPEVNDKDIELEIEYEDAWDETHITLMFSSLETDKEYNERITKEEKKRYNEKVAKLNSIREFLEANPEMKNEFLNNYV
jgi:hypothetical protein